MTTVAEDPEPKSKAEREILGFLQAHDLIEDSHQFAATIGVSHNDVESVIRSLCGFEFVNAKDIKREKWVLTDESKKYVVNGSPEVQVFMAVPPEGISRADLENRVDSEILKIGSSQAVKNRWLEIRKDSVSRKVDHVEDRIQDLLNKIEHGEVHAIIYKSSCDLCPAVNYFLIK